MRRSLVLALVLSVAPPAIAGDPPSTPPKPAPEKPPTPEQAADAVMAAVKAKDGAALKTLAARDDPDPWLVADELLARAEAKAADAFAKAAPRKDVERLPAYVASWAAKPDDGAARKALAAANAAFGARKWKEGLDALGPADAAAPAAEVVDIVAIRRVHGRGAALAALDRREESVKAFLVAADAAERIGWLARASRALDEAGSSAWRRADYPRALSAWERRRAISEARGDRMGVATSLNNIGVVCTEIGDFPRALELAERTLTMGEESGDRAGVARAHGNIGNVQQSLGNFAKALEHYERARRLMEEAGDRAGVAATLGNMGNAYLALGDYPNALECQERALAMKEAEGDRAGLARTLGNLGLVHDMLGNTAKALEIQERALKMKEAVDDRAGAAATLGNIGTLYSALGQRQRALECQERALKMKEELGDRVGAATTLGNIGVLHDALRNFPKALEIQERALKAMQDLGDREGVARTLGNIGIIAGEMADLPKAEKSLDRAVREAERIRADPVLAWALREQARGQLSAKEPRLAVQTAKRGVGLLERMLAGLGEEQGAQAREQHADLFSVGTLAAARSDDAGEAAFFLESGRAGALMESLGGRQALRWQAIPEELRRADADARAGESVALVAYTRALDDGDRPTMQSRLEALDAARAKVSEVVQRIQRGAKKAASVFYPRAATLEELEAWVRKGEALVLYGLCLDEALALVVTHGASRIVSLGKSAEIAAACEVLDWKDAKADPRAALEALRRLLVAPLALEGDVTRVLVSPEGPLSYVPMSALFPDREVAYEPSGTTYGLLLEDANKRGERVLAIGDADYGAKFEPRALDVYVPGGVPGEAPGERGGRLVPLPGTREEAKAIGDVTLLGKDASEAGLRAAIATSRDRWHAVHFACHGLVDPENPTRSSLVLTPDAGNDGFLTALEVLGMEIPSDLVVLSACETGKGRIVKGEGIVGLTRAFMFAGTPRVICSLWKVDDEATRALMVKFYSLWNPSPHDRAGGTKPMGTAAALRAAQEYVRSQPKWAHPYYWAAWVLWGLPD